MRVTGAVVAVVLVGVAASPVAAQDGAALFTRDCAVCHTTNEAPSREAMGQLSPNAIVTALTTGAMRSAGSVLTVPERRAVAEFLTGKPVSADAVDASIGRCASSGSMPDPTTGVQWNGWGVDVRNTRFQARQQGGLTAADLPRLKLKWAFGFRDVVAARAQPAVVGGRVFVGSDEGTVYALDAATGCTHWTFRAKSGARTAMSVGPYASGGTTGVAVFFGDGLANAYAVDATTGRQIWTRRVDDHPSARITGSPTLHDGRLYVAVAGLGEEAQGGRAQYECCTFRGSVSALDASTGAVVWKTYVLPELQSRGKNKQGVPQWGPAGAGIWAAPTVDVKRGAIYVSTGNGYAEPAQPTMNAVVALDLATGAIRWSHQTTAGDIWTMGCQPTNPDNPNCPATLGPDMDFSASPVLATSSAGRDLIVVPQKSGMAYALDPEARGALVWQYRAGEGSGLGGVWGAAVEGDRVFVAANGLLSPSPGGMNAVRLDTGERLWYTPPPPRLCGDARGCLAAQGAAVTAIPGAVLSGSHDGGLRAFSAEDGVIIWTLDTNRSFETVNGVPANGGSIDGPGAVAVGGMLFVNSGYGGIAGRPGNVLLAFGLD